MSTRVTSAGIDRAALHREPAERGSAPPHIPPFPRYSVALVQNESEMIQAPGFDLSSFLSAECRPWDVDLYTERTLDTLIRAAGHYDCIVIGYNATHNSSLIVEQLGQQLSETPLCVLHQINAEGLSFLQEDLALQHVNLGDAWNRQVMVAAGLEMAEEIVLNWPHPFELDAPPSPHDEHRSMKGREVASFQQVQISVPHVAKRSAGVREVTVAMLRDGGALCAAKPSGAGRWRTILEVDHDERRLPVLLRTSSRKKPRVLVCTALLDHAHPGHAALLDNIVMWCAAGRPTTAVITGSRPDEAGHVHRTLRLQGTRSILHESEEVDLMSWPCRGVSHVVLARADDPTEHDGSVSSESAAEWMKRDGTIVVVEPTPGGADPDVTVKHCAVSDELWVARLWGTWFSGIPPATWLGDEQHSASIVRSKAVLQVLDEVNHLGAEQLERLRAKGSGEEPDGTRTGYPDPTEFREQMTQLLEQRIGNGDNCEETIATTIACMDIDRLAGAGVVNRIAVEARLRKEAGLASTAFADRLDVARFFGDGELLAELLGQWPDSSTASAVLETKLREAVVACKIPPDDPEVARLRSISRKWLTNTVTERELCHSPLLAANYLNALLRLQEHWGNDLPALKAPDTARDRAITTIARRGYLISGKGTEGRAHEFVGAEARALMAYFRSCKVGTHVVRDEVEAFPPQLIDALVREAETLRIKGAEVDHLKTRLEWGRNALAGAALAAVLFFAWLIYPAADQIEQNPILGTLGLVGVIVIPMLILLAALHRFDLCPDRARTAGIAVAGGFDGIIERLKNYLSSRPQAGP